jgi:hypothetical protein
MSELELRQFRLNGTSIPSEEYWKRKRKKLRERMEKAGHPCLSEWDGDSKWWTRNCVECKHHITLDEDQVCTIGVTWKTLIKPDKPRRCGLI